MSASYLDGILAFHRARSAGDVRDVDELAEQAGAATEPVRDFSAALRSGGGPRSPAVIAEIKRRSPSKGNLAIDLEPGVVALDFEGGGAAALSVLTDATHFAGSAPDLALARAATRLPVLRKDFTVSEKDIYDARLMGADAVLLIVSALSDDELARFVKVAEDLGLAALVEVHDLSEADRALGAGASLIGVNQRDLRTFEVDTARAIALAEALGGREVLKVAESGIRNASDVQALGEAGYDAVLVGETLVTSADRGAAVRALTVGAGR